jgi:hypothetical protein
MTEHMLSILDEPDGTGYNPINPAGKEVKLMISQENGPARSRSFSSSVLSLNRM